MKGLFVMKTIISGVRKALGIAAIASAVMAAAPFTTQVLAAGDAPHIDRQKWTFGGFFGYYDKQQLQRGYQVYKEVCASCHGLKYLSYRNLGQEGGPQFSEAAVKALAKEAEVQDGPNEEGEMFARPGKPSDRFVSPFPNAQAARAANGGAFPPDLSIIAKARTIHTPTGYMEPVHWLKDIVTGYQEGGPDYLYALLTGYGEAPAKVKLGEGMNYNKYFPGQQIAMAAPLSDDAVEYSDGSPQTTAQYAKDVTAFLMWAADPTLQERKQLGFRVMIYLLIFALILYLAKKSAWRRVKH